MDLNVAGFVVGLVGVALGIPSLLYAIKSKNEAIRVQEMSKRFEDFVSLKFCDLASDLKDVEDNAGLAYTHVPIVRDYLLRSGKAESLEVRKAMSHQQGDLTVTRRALKRVNASLASTIKNLYNVDVTAKVSASSSNDSLSPSNNLGVSEPRRRRGLGYICTGMIGKQARTGASLL